MSDSNTLPTSFAIAGAGDVGLLVVRALASATPRPRIVVLSRSLSNLPSLPDGVQTAEVDYTDVPGLQAVFEQHGVQVVISTVSTAAIDSQYTLADAAKKAGVELFVPGEFGAPTEGATEGLFLTKFKVVEHLRSIGLPFVRFWTGGFIEWLSIVLSTHNGKANLVVKGVTPGSFTSVEDIAGFVAHVFTTLPLARLRNATFRLEGHRASFQEIAAILNLPIEHVETIPAPSPEHAGFIAMLQRGFESGHASIRWDHKKGRELTPEEYEGEDAKLLWPEHVWKKIGEVPMK